MPDQPTGAYSMANLKRLTYLLDNQFKVPFTQYRLGLDFLIGLIPLAGDLVTSLVSLHILIAARKYGVHRQILWKMLGNIGVDFLVGIVPVIGDFLDAGWKANARNMKLLVNAIEQHQSADKPANPGGAAGESPQW